VRRNNDELVARWGNLVNRVLTLTRRNFEERVPAPPATLAPESRAMLDAVDAAFEEAGNHIEAVNLRNALGAAMNVATHANRYLDERAPWVAVRSDRNHAAETLFVAVNVVSGLATLLQPFLPFTSSEAWAFCGHDTSQGGIEAAGWRRTPVEAGTHLPEPHPLYKKLDDSLVEEEEARLGK
jgi:methionyl-tRNA synthetase